MYIRIPLFSITSERMNITRAKMAPIMVQATSVHFLSDSKKQKRDTSNGQFIKAIKFLFEHLWIKVY